MTGVSLKVHASDPSRTSMLWIQNTIKIVPSPVYTTYTGHPAIKGDSVFRLVSISYLISYYYDTQQYRK